MVRKFESDDYPEPQDIKPMPGQHMAGQLKIDELDEKYRFVQQYHGTTQVRLMQEKDENGEWKTIITVNSNA